MSYTLSDVISKASVIIFTTLLLIIPVSIKAQNEKTISLQEAIHLALKNSHVLKAAAARNEQAAAQLEQALKSRLPNANISGSYLRMAHPDLNIKTDGFSGQPDTSANKKSMPSVNQAMYGIANISYPVFTGGKIRYAIESARYLKHAVELDGENNKEAAILNTINAYINLFKASATVKVVEENLAQSKQRDSVFSRLEQNGLLARNDLLKAQLQTSTISLSLLDAQNNLKTANINMCLLLGVDEGTIIKTDPATFSREIILNTIEDYQQQALQNRKDLQAISFRKKAASTAMSLAKAEMYPSIALTGGYVAADIPRLITITNAVNVGIGIQYSLSSLWKTRSKIKEAKAHNIEIEENEAQLYDAIKIAIIRDYENVLLSRKKTEVYDKALSQAQENFRITKNKYENSLVNTTELLDANVLLLQAEINLAGAKADELSAYSALLETTGTLTGNE